MTENKMAMTKEGMDKLEKEYRELIDVERPEVIEQLAQARSQGDLSENADYDAARDKQAKIEARISEIEHIKDIAIIVKENPKLAGKKINIGYLVTYKDLSENAERKVKIVGTIEADPFAPTPLVSDQSALGKALIGQNAGDKVTVESEEPYEIEILKAELGK